MKIKSRLLLGLIIIGLCTWANIAFGEGQTKQWDFTVPGDYVYDQDKIEVGLGSAEIKPLDQTDNSQAKFDFGMPDKTGYSGVALELKRYIPVEIGADDSLCSLWHFNENKDTRLTDASVKDNAGVISAAKWAPGRFGSALNFNGLSSYVTIPYSDSLDISSAVTLEAWINPAKTGSGWYYPGWEYRTPIILSNKNSFALLDYQIPLSINTSVLISKNKMQAQGADIRFSNVQDCTNLNYWIESGINTSITKIWVKLDVLPPGESTIYMYYGNSSAQSVSNGQATFDLFEDFNNGLSDWTIASGKADWTIDLGKDLEDPVNMLTHKLSAVNVVARAKKNLSDTDDLIYEFKMRQKGTPGNAPFAGVEIKSPDTDYADYDQGYLFLSYADQGKLKKNNFEVFKAKEGELTSLYSAFKTFELDEWYAYKIIYSKDKVMVYINDSLVTSLDDLSLFTKGEVLRLYASKDVDVDFADLKVHKYLLLDPQVSNIAKEQKEEGAKIISKSGSYGLVVSPNPINSIKGIINEQVISAGLNLNVWNHLVLTYDGVKQNLYVNGQLRASGNLIAAINQNKNAILIGNNFEGVIDEAAIWNRVLSADEIARHAGSYPYSGTFISRVMDAGVSCAWTGIEWDGTEVSQPTQWQEADGAGGALWHFDENSATAISDTSVNANSGYLSLGELGNKSARDAWADGKFGSAIVLDGQDDYIKVSDSRSLNMNSAISLAGWIKIDKFGSILNKQNSYLLGLTKVGKPIFSLNINDAATQQVLVSPNPLLLGTWYYLVATYDGQYMKLYVNGSLETQIPVKGKIYNDTVDLFIGADSLDQGFYAGLIDELRIYSRALNNQEILDNYVKGVMGLRFQAQSSSSPSIDAELMGPDGKASSYFRGEDGKSFSLSRVANNRYFQYKIYLDTLDTAFSPQVKSVSVGPKHYPRDNPYIQSVYPMKIGPLTKFQETGESIKGVTVKYQLSANNKDWYYYQGKQWAITEAGYKESNSAVEVNTHIKDFSKELNNPENLYFRAYFHYEE